MKFRILLITLSFLLVASGALVLYHTRPLYAWDQVAPATIGHAQLKAVESSQPADEPASQKTIKQAIDSVPLQIKIPDLGIDINLTPGNYDFATSQWQITDHAAFFALVSDYENLEIGNNLFIYGHNSRDVFGKLPYIKASSKVYIITEDGDSAEFSFIESKIVKPTEANIFDYTGKPKLILQTCTGAFNQLRQIIYLERTN